MRFKPFHITPSILDKFIPPRVDRVIAIMKSPLCDMCGDDTVPDFTPIIFVEESETANGVWACIDCWHKLNTETISDNMLESISETVEGIKVTNMIRNSWQYNDIYHTSALWMK